MVALSRASLGPGRLQFLNSPRRIQVQRLRSDERRASAARVQDDGAVTTDIGLISISGRWRRVAAVLERWRIDDEWWRSQPVSRLYYTVLLEGGKRLDIFQDLTDGQWYGQQ